MFIRRVFVDLELPLESESIRCSKKTKIDLIFLRYIKCYFGVVVDVEV